MEAIAIRLEAIATNVTRSIFIFLTIWFSSEEPAHRGTSHRKPVATEVLAGDYCPVAFRQAPRGDGLVWSGLDEETSQASYGESKLGAMVHQLDQVGQPVLDLFRGLRNGWLKEMIRDFRPMWETDCPVREAGQNPEKGHGKGYHSCHRSPLRCLDATWFTSADASEHF